MHGYDAIAQVYESLSKVSNNIEHAPNYGNFLVLVLGLGPFWTNKVLLLENENPWHKRINPAHV
jgi:hypothetical protein